MSDAGEFSAAEIEEMIRRLDEFSPEEQSEIEQLADVLQQRKLAAQCRDDLIAFCKHMDPNYKVGKHHRRLADLLMKMERGEEDRIGVSVPPRHGKSQMVSIFFPAWYLGRNPDKKVLMVSHTADLAVDFGRKVRNTVDSPAYKQIFPTVTLASDSKSAGRWNTNMGGEYFACGVGAALAGRGAHFLIVDDPFSEQDVLNGNYSVFDRVYEWFTYGARTRLMPQGKVAIVHTRWHPNDLLGRLAKDMGRIELADKYEMFEFPAIFNENTDHEKALWPDFYDLDALHRTKSSMPLFQWNAQFQQNPTAEEGALIKREWWKRWEPEDPPTCEYIIMTLDAAAEKHNRADFTALLTWGVFSSERYTEGNNHIILLNAINVRVEFAELKELAIREYKEWQPDSFIVEKKSSGTPLFQEMRRMGIPVQEFTPHRGTGDKIARVNAISDIFRSGLVWYPEGLKWAEAVVEQVAGFPASDHDDMVDCVSMALERFRNGGFIRLDSDADEGVFYPRTAAYY